MPTLPAFDPLSLPESNATGYPQPYAEDQKKRFNRRLGNHAGLTNFGVNLTRILPGGQSSALHGHSRQDEFVWVLEGETVLETEAGEQLLRPGQCAGFPAGSGGAPRVLNRGDRDVLLLVGGDRTARGEGHYPGIDMAGRQLPGGKFLFTRKDGSAF